MLQFTTRIQRATLSQNVNYPSVVSDATFLQTDIGSFGRAFFSGCEKAPGLQRGKVLARGRPPLVLALYPIPSALIGFNGGKRTAERRRERGRGRGLSRANALRNVLSGCPFGSLCIPAKILTRLAKHRGVRVKRLAGTQNVFNPFFSKQRTHSQKIVRPSIVMQKGEVEFNFRCTRVCV